ncbi:hypothetical protein I79_021630 [Cricetulus griseus]|uniref:Uncharacterized protein n=1 Tax=Cricetulus griseus TaxID=10029 RepID=G3ID58_CRIGR|nr:hypothetical protein I79_021630 [Cricetulus griseus]
MCRKSQDPREKSGQGPREIDIVLYCREKTASSLNSDKLEGDDKYACFLIRSLEWPCTK